MRPIDADKILEINEFETKLIGKDWAIDDLVAAIEYAPILDVVPVVHARWSEKRWMTDDDWGVINHRAIVCSACKGEIADGGTNVLLPELWCKDGQRTGE